jgi:hypothetical protein
MGYLNWFDWFMIGLATVTMVSFIVWLARAIVKFFTR